MNPPVMRIFLRRISSLTVSYSMMETTFVVRRLRTEHTSKHILLVSQITVSSPLEGINTASADLCQIPVLPYELWEYEGYDFPRHTSTSDTMILGKSTIQNVDGKVNQTMSHTGIAISITVNTIRGGTIVSLLPMNRSGSVSMRLGPRHPLRTTRMRQSVLMDRYRIFSLNCPMTCSRFDTIPQTRLECTLETPGTHQATRWHSSMVS